MFNSLRIGRYFGIDVFVHPTFWLLPVFVLLSSGLGGGFGQAVLDVAVLFAVFGCVALHEFGHALAAHGFGIRTRDITLYPIGGVARLEGVPERPWPEVVIALAGPAVNVAIAAVLAAVMAVTGIGVRSAFDDGLGVDAFLGRLLVANVGLVLFNLIPAFPMDGGRVFRALVQMATDRLTATRVAVWVGTGFAGLIALFGLWQGQLMLVVLAGFVVITGRAELAAVRMRHEEDEALRRRYERAPRYRDDWDRPARDEVELLDGWQHDPLTGVWTFWRNGTPVRRLRPRM